MISQSVSQGADGQSPLSFSHECLGVYCLANYVNLCNLWLAKIINTITCATLRYVNRWPLALPLLAVSYRTVWQGKAKAHNDVIVPRSRCNCVGMNEMR